jgi:hypothetical protein
MDVLATLNSAVAAMPEPNYRTENLALTFSVVSPGGITLDSAGNEVSPAARVVVKASVVTSNKQSGDMPLPGSGQNSLLLKGRLLNPKYLPSTVTLQDEAIAIYTDTVSGQTLKGKWRFLPTTQSRIGDVTKKFGQKIEGELIVLGVA